MEKYESENVKDDFVHVSKVTFPGGQQDSRDFGKDLQEICTCNTGDLLVPVMDHTDLSN